MVRFSGFARKTNHIPFFASEASNRLSKISSSLTILVVTTFGELLKFPERQFLSEILPVCT
ncbi:MAG: hypothetical protein U5L45_08315 [Saprospiraceae bacterium]|nr:hypothetical protein [Saprospiraceae bacterium]